MQDHRDHNERDDHNDETGNGLDAEVGEDLLDKIEHGGRAEFKRLDHIGGNVACLHGKDGDQNQPDGAERLDHEQNAGKPTEETDLEAADHERDDGKRGEREPRDEDDVPHDRRRVGKSGDRLPDEAEQLREGVGEEVIKFHHICTSSVRFSVVPIIPQRFF